MSVRNIDYQSVRFTQEHFYPHFSNGKMSVSEIYVALANGFLDPTSLVPITIFEYNEHLYCIDTRRLKITKELQRRRKFDVLKRFPFQYVKKSDEKFASQYANLVDDRLPAMKKKGLDGSTVKLCGKSDDMCCYNLASGNFRDDLDEHIAHDHLHMTVLTFKELNVYQCNKKSQISIIKPPNKTNYRFIQNCTCPNSELMVLHTINKPWTEVTFQEICDVFLCLNATVLHRSTSVVKSGYSIERSNIFTSPSTRPIPLIKSPL
jgi:hypothetical protein